jgi:hypothetical protein
MAKSSFNVRVEIDGIFETLRALNKLPKEANDQIRKKSLELSKDLAGKAQRSGIAEGSQAALVATTVKARRDRVPVVAAGGTKRLGRNRKPAYKLLFGSEFGADKLKQYKPHIGSGSYWFFKTVDENKQEIAGEWRKAADEIVRSFGEV